MFLSDHRSSKIGQRLNLIEHVAIRYVIQKHYRVKCMPDPRRHGNNFRARKLPLFIVQPDQLSAPGCVHIRPIESRIQRSSLNVMNVASCLCLSTPSSLLFAFSASFVSSYLTHSKFQ